MNLSQQMPYNGTWGFCMGQYFKFIHHVGESPDTLHGTMIKHAGQAEFRAGPVQADASLIGIQSQSFQGCCADLPARRVNDAKKCSIVIRVNEETQVPKDILDFSTIEK